jgi:beta-phosphoglucomutase-like phosphatase (HAD superfamily)
MLSNQDVKKSKPAPDIYLKAAELLNLRPDECLVVEDNQHGIAAATAAGTHILVVGSVTDVNYQNILARIAQIEGFK